MKKTTYILNLFFLVIAMVVVTTAQTSDRADGMRFIPDVPHAFYNLAEYPETLGLNITTTPDPSTCRHYQGMTRHEGADGTPFFYLTRSGNTPPIPGEIGCDDSPGETRNGHLIVFRMDSRDKNGERIRSNRLRKGVHVGNTQPVSLDRATIYFTIVGGYPHDPDPARRPGLILRDGPDSSIAPHRVYQHPGGGQQVGKILAIPLEKPRQNGSGADLNRCIFSLDLDACDRYFNYPQAPYKSAIHFYDTSDPEDPQFRSQFIPRNAAGEVLEDAGTLGITPLPNGRYLMVLTGGASNETWHFYRSNGTDLASENLTWHYVDAVPGPGTVDAHQTLNFLREGNINGKLYLAGARGIVLQDDRDKIDLYEVYGQTPNFEPGEVSTPVHFNNKAISPFPSTGGNKLLALSAASGFYVSPSGELLFYAAEHDNDGPGESVRAGEWRHVDVVRPGSPTLNPSAKIDGPFEVDEGSAVALTGTGKSPITKAFIQLFNGRNYGPRYLTSDFSDRNRDDFDNLFDYEGGMADRAKSWAWFAPPGCSIQAIDRVDENTDEIDEMKTLTGATTQQGDPDLSVVMHDGGTDDIDQEVDRVLFASDCGNYYNTQIGLFWDTNNDGSFDAQGNSVNFSAAMLDGPSIVQVPVEARHPSGGGAGVAGTRVTVRNVRPTFSQFAMTDSGGNQINTTVPWVLTGLPVTLAGTFTDPGIPDHQIGQISWGDGTATESNPVFDAFDEAFGDGTGSMSHRHVFTAPGNFIVEGAVADDDGGFDIGSESITVLTPAQAVGEIVAMIDAAIAAATDPTVIDQLKHARLALTGNRPTSQNGALQMIESGNNDAAIAFLGTCSTWLQRAQEGGSNVALPLTLVQQVAAALEN